MIQRYYLIVVAIAILCSVEWLLIIERVTVTSGVSMAAWAFAAIYGNEVTRQFESGAVDAPVPEEIRFFFFLFALLSLVVFILYRLGVYPPQDNTPLDSDVTN